MELNGLTGYESGVIIFKNANEGIITNWVGIDGIPRIFVTGMIGLSDGDDLQKVEITDIEDVYFDIAMDIARENHRENDEPDEPEINGVWENDEVLIVTFQGWA